ncbi:MAG: phosphoribosylglycinamide formyltransferase [Deltaproteobacteria bacterium]|nr:phosphoribosylglycinamide formyltransferase [Deltaproteobacteria bacterium]
MRKIVDIGILVSGSGSNFQSIIDQIEQGNLDASIKVVVSNNPDAYALERAKKHNIPAVVIDHNNFNDRNEFDQEMIDVLNSYSVELVIMAGFMRILTPLFIKAFPMRIMNIHPAILPSFQGIHAQERAFDYGVKFSGCSVHFADEGVDTGPVIIQSVVPVYNDDTAETLQQRILREEHRIFPQAIQFYAEGKLEIIGRKVIVKDHKRIDETPLHNPPLTKF